PPPPSTLSLHDALPICRDLGAAARLAEHQDPRGVAAEVADVVADPLEGQDQIQLARVAAVRKSWIEPREVQISERIQPVVDSDRDRKSTRLNSSHDQIS